MGRRRNRRNAGLAANLYENKVKGRVYYRYKHPVTGEFHSLGTDRGKANAAAKQLNERLMDASDLVTRVLGGKRVDDLIDAFDRDVLIPRNYAENTRTDYLRHIRALAKDLSGKHVGDVTTQDIAIHLDQFPPRSSNQRRNTAILFFRYARSKGLTDFNPAKVTLPRAHVVQRMRLPLDQFQAIYEHAAQPIRNAMDLSLETLQARLEVSRMRFPAKHDKYLEVVRQKTEKASLERAKRGKEASAYLRIRISERLAEIIKRCRDDAASAYLVHYGIDSRYRATIGRPLTGREISRGFKNARDMAISANPDLFRLSDGRMPKPAQLPSFHEVRGLGADLKREAGWPEERIQKLMAHTEVKMTKEYLEGHREHWVTVEL